MAQGNGSDGSDRMERLMEVVVNTQADMPQDVKILYRSQVVMGEKLNEVSEKLRELSEAQTRTDSNLSALILTVDEMIRGRKRE